jgi:hypothetical protein
LDSLSLRDALPVGLFRESQRPGQVAVMVATDALRSSYVFPAESARQAHLAYLLAWLETRGGRERRLEKAQAEEQHSIATSLEPALERGVLSDAVERWGDANKADKARVASKEAKTIHGALAQELVRRFDLVERAIRHLKDDSREFNPGVDRLVAAGFEEQWYQYLRMEKRMDDETDGPAFTPSPETDRYAPAAASRYYIHQASEEFRLAALIHHDEELQAEVLAAGDGIRGMIRRVDDEGTGRERIPVWRIDVPDEAPLRARVGTCLCVAGLPSRVVEIRRIERKRGGGLDVEVEVTGLKTTPRLNPTGVWPASDSRYQGVEVTLLPVSKDRIPREKSKRVWNRESPGAWLTHVAPGGVKAVMPADVGENLVSLVEGA